ncbi:4'-phosphopantetheinyl transferase [Nitrosomonas nitrosa]|uniref:4'-phosphopantetheinyl transferase n=1 Tax=Nitrosomonas nitrosa TaxID=52442 RepID=A0A8H9DBE4_9PROT|nr:4'-phosphopantetheinyl transferase superfamily protein [Nitrosomonas nitrosa]CAE6517786.1 4'-phosphopantetheinyl transferase [Nitrosomonas nitrosa]
MKRVQLPETLPTDTEVWLLEFDFDSTRLAEDWALLSTQEKERALRFHQFKDQIRTIATRAALRRLLAKHIGSSPRTLRIDVNDFGKPRLQADSAPAFNVTHAGSFALIALSTQSEVGIDIESRNRDMTHLDAYVLSPKERDLGIWSSENLIELWVIKESALKALGVGIAEYLQAITVLPNQDGSYRIAHDRASWTTIQAWSIEAPNHYVAALSLMQHRPLCDRSQSFFF